MQLCKLCIRCKLLQMLRATLIYCAAALAAAKSRGGPSWTAAQRAIRHERLRATTGRHTTGDRDALVAAFERLFRENSTQGFPTGIGESISSRMEPRIVNAWKSDDSVASVADAAIGKRRGSDGLARRAAQDDVLWKPPGASGVAYHTDGKDVFRTTSFPFAQRRSIALTTTAIGGGRK